MPLPPHVRAALRIVLRELNDDVTDYLQERVNAVHEGITPGTTTLDQITNIKGRADGAAELWAQLEMWALEGDPGE